MIDQVKGGEKKCSLLNKDLEDNDVQESLEGFLHGT